MFQYFSIAILLHIPFLLVRVDFNFRQMVLNNLEDSTLLEIIQLLAR